MTTLETDIVALDSMTPAELRARWRRVFRRETPPHSPDLLARAIAWKLQSKLHGDLPRPVRRTLDAMASSGGKSVASDRSVPAAPLPGTRLIRDWNGRSIEVLVTDDGFLFEGSQYRSLSEIARTVTGARWSGPRFFGLVKRKRESMAPGTAAGHGTSAQ